MHIADPVCGTWIESTKAAATATEILEGQTYYFCSSFCHDKFRANPGRFMEEGQSSKDIGRTIAEHIIR